MNMTKYGEDFSGKQLSIPNIIDVGKQVSTLVFLFGMEGVQRN